MKSLKLIERINLPLDEKEIILKDLKLLQRESRYRIKAEESLRIYKQQNRATLNAIRDPIHIINANLEIVFVNDALVKMLDFLNLESNILYRKITDVFPFLPEYVFTEYLDVFDTQIEVFTTGRFLRKGNEYMVETSKTPVIREGKVIQIVTTIRKITNQNDSTKGVYKRDWEFSNFVEKSYDGIILTDEEGRIIEWNHAQERISGLKSSDTLGKNLWDIQHILAPLDNRSQSSYEKNKKRIKAILNTGTAPWIKKLNEKKITTVNGTSKVIQSNVFPIKSERGYMLGSIIRDITSFHEAEIVKTELENRRTKFIEITSHELRTPLTCIQGFIDFLRNSGNNITDLQKEELYELLEKNINRLNSLIDEVSDFAKIERDALVIVKKTVNFVEYITNEIKTYKIILGDQFTFHSKLPASLVYASIDENRFRQVLGNIIDNAIKHTHNDTRHVYMGVKIHSKTIQLDIGDNGAGVAPENLKKVFEPFVSIPSDYSVTGTGIGLYISNEIIRQHNGTIEAISKGLGTGTIIKIVVPRIYPENNLLD